MDREICRLCSQPITGVRRSLQEVAVGSMEMFTPKMNYAESQDPCICNECLDSAQSNYIKKEKEEINQNKIEDTCLINPSIKIEEIEMKQEELKKEVIPVTIPCHEIKKEEDEEGDTPQNIPHNLTHTETESGCSLDEKSDNVNTNHQCHVESQHLKQHNPSEARMYECYNTGCKCKRHQFVMDVQNYTCDKCDYVTYTKSNLTNHQLKHKNPWEVHMYKCDKCQYESKRKGNLKVHQLCHIEVRMYKCDRCSSEFKAKSYLMRHQMTHKNPSEVPMHRCDECQYESKHKANLKAHMLVHRGPSEVQMYKCDMCTFETKNKAYLTQHVLKTHRCGECEFETEYRLVLKKHQLVHRDPSQHKNPS